MGDKVNLHTVEIIDSRKGGMIEEKIVGMIGEIEEISGEMIEGMIGGEMTEGKTGGTIVEEMIGEIGRTIKEEVVDSGVKEGEVMTTIVTIIDMVKVQVVIVKDVN